MTVPRPCKDDMGKYGTIIRWYNNDFGKNVYYKEGDVMKNACSVMMLVAIIFLLATACTPELGRVKPTFEMNDISNEESPNNSSFGLLLSITNDLLVTRESRVLKK